MEENPAIALFLALSIIIAASRLGGAAARQLGQPRVLGELIIGVILGPTLLNMLEWDIFHGVELQETIKELAEIGVLLLMFIVGLEVNPRELRKVGNVGVFAGILGAVVPVMIAFPTARLFGYAWQPALLAGITLAATSVSISAQVLLELGVLRTKEGNALLATALIDDVLAIVLVSVAVALISSGAGEETLEIGGILAIIGRMALYMVVAFLIAWFAVPRLMNWINRQPPLQQSFGIPAFALILVFLFAWSAEELGGVATITGAFIAGVGISRATEHIKHEVEEGASFIAYAFLVPIFFVDVGLETNLSQFSLSTIPLALVLLVVAIVTKVLGCGFGARLGGFSRSEATRLGVCMVSRGEVGLIIASLGISVGVFNTGDNLFIALFFTILLTTLITPILVRQVFKPTTEGTS
jgi:Kef-type K+ transport system membrane component KefB